jgi:hypothetical protein
MFREVLAALTTPASHYARRFGLFAKVSLSKHVVVVVIRIGRHISGAVIAQFWRKFRNALITT